MAECANLRRKHMQSSGQSSFASRSRAELAQLLSLYAGAGSRASTINREQVRRLRAALAESLHGGGLPSRQLARQLQRIERKCRFTSSGRAEFQTLLGTLGLDSAFPIQVPVNSEPRWSHHIHPLKHYRSQPQLPREADIVIIGAGLTGASAAYHLRNRTKRLRVVVLDRGSPAGEASGRNAGNFELLPENSVGTYDGLARERLHFLSRCYPALPREVLRVEADRQASMVFSFALRNRERLTHIIEQEKLACDFSPKGWLYLAHTEREEQAICDELALATAQDQQFEIWSRMKIREEFGFERGFIGRFVPRDGTYHPAKFVYGVLQLAVNAGVELYTGVSVRGVHEASDGRHAIETDEGSLLARSVIAATNAFTRQLFPELGAIRPAQSQISVTEFAPDRCRGRAVTCEEGPVYFNQPREGASDGLAPLLLGGGKDRPMRNPLSRRRSRKVHARLLELRDRFFPELHRRPFSTEWIGPIALTPDQLPAIGFLKPSIIVAAGFNGYGGSYCVAAGQAAAEMAISGAVPDWLPEDVFSPRRLLNQTPLFIAETSNLWCYAASLCVQLRATNRQLIEALEYSSRPFRPRLTFQTQNSGDGKNSVTQFAMPVTSIQGLKPFRGFSDQECAEILAMARTRIAREGETLLAESSPGDACFVIVKGTVDVSSESRGTEKVLRRLGTSSIFGQLALIDGGGSNGTYAVREDTVLLEMKYDGCHQLLARHSPLAYKFLAALTEGVINELRAAQRHLNRLNGHQGPGFSRQSRRGA
jgi:glycine/D-amino acid oxidase-like deaminating enzyme/CRP-like cAMP-binding protein